MGRHAEKRASPSRVVTRLRGLRKVRALSQRKEWAKKKKKKKLVGGSVTSWESLFA